MDDLWKDMVEAAKESLEQKGLRIEKVPGRGRSNIWRAFEGDGDTQGKKVAIRTSKDRWFAFPAEPNGWKTLDDVDMVVVATVNDRENPTHFEVFHFDQQEVRKRFDYARKFRVGAGNTVRNGYGMWISIDHVDSDLPHAAGSGLGDEHPFVFSSPIEPFLTDTVAKGKADSEVEVPDGSNDTSIKGVMDRTRTAIAKIAGVDVANVKLELKIDY